MICLPAMRHDSRHYVFLKWEWSFGFLNQESSGGGKIRQGNNLDVQTVSSNTVWLKIPDFSRNTFFIGREPWNRHFFLRETFSIPPLALAPWCNHHAWYWRRRLQGYFMLTACLLPDNLAKSIKSLPRFLKEFSKSALLLAFSSSFSLFSTWRDKIITLKCKTTSHHIQKNSCISQHKSSQKKWS